MKTLAPLLLVLVACGPVEEADPILRPGDECSSSYPVPTLCNGEGQAAVICVAGKYVLLPQRCQSACRAPGDYCDTGFQAPGAKCIGEGWACSDSMQRVLCKNGVYTESVSCDYSGGCETVNGVSNCKRYVSP